MVPLIRACRVMPVTGTNYAGVVELLDTHVSKTCALSGAWELNNDEPDPRLAQHGGGRSRLPAGTMTLFP